MLTRNALKKPKKPAYIKIEFKYNELATAIKQKASVIPLYGSVVKARDKRMGICCPQVWYDTSHKAINDKIINKMSPMTQSLRNNIFFMYKFIYFYTPHIYQSFLINVIV